VPSGIKALLEIANRDPQKLAASDLVALGPRLNAAGRLDDMSVGVALLLCDNVGEARMLANELDALNQTRKEIEQGMQAEALTLCQQLERSGDTLPGGWRCIIRSGTRVVGFWRRGLKSVSIARLSPSPQPATAVKRLRALYPGVAHARCA
jgi:single-stranded DNA-specific DHH superfamily exonuclease